MNKMIHHIETLVYYDGPQLFLASDQVNTKYLCILSDRKELDSYLCVPISNKRLSEFYDGIIDLRDIYVNSETQELFYIEVKELSQQEFFIKSIPITEVPEAWLPEIGFKFQKEKLPDELVIREAVEKNRAVIHLALNPPEARAETRIHAEHLSQALILFQRLIKYCYRKALKDVSEENRKLIDMPENYEVDVFAFSKGSFTLHLQSSALADMVGYAEVSRALNKIDLITHTLNDPEATLEVLKQNGGHLVRAYRDLLEFIVKRDSPIFYEWTSPDSRKTISRRITKECASPIYDLLLKKQELGVEEKFLIGIVHKIDIDNGAWRLLSEEDSKSYSGKTDFTKLHRKDINITVGPPYRYKFKCEERLEEETATGREIAVLWLVSYEEL